MKVHSTNVTIDSSKKTVCAAISLEQFEFPLPIELNKVNSRINGLLKSRLEQSLCVQKTLNEHKDFALNNLNLILSEVNQTTKILDTNDMEMAFKKVFSDIVGESLSF